MLPTSPEHLFVQRPEEVRSSGELAGVTLQACARFVLEKQPVIIEDIRLGKATRQHLIGAQVDALLDDMDQLVSPTPEFHDVTTTLRHFPRESTLTSLLDLQMMQSAHLPYVSSFETIPGTIRKSITALSEKIGVIPYMTYELIIDQNAHQTYHYGNPTRTFTYGEVGLSERDFYLGHRLAEGHLKQAVSLLAPLLHMHAPDGVMNERLEAAVPEIEQFATFVSRYMLLPKEHFEIIRRNLTSYPDGTRNASGAFLPTIQTLDIILNGVTPEKLEFIKEAFPYFPADGAKRIQIALDEYTQNGRTLKATIERSGDSKSEDFYNQIVNHLLAFRHTHRQATRKQIENAFPDDEPNAKKDYETYVIRRGYAPLAETSAGYAVGTAGFNISHVLGNAVLDTLGSRINPSDQMLYKGDENE